MRSGIDTLEEKHKVCPVCKFDKYIYDYHKSKRRYDGLDWRCKVCSAKAKTDFYFSNKERINRRNNEGFKANTARSLLRGAKGRSTRNGIPFDLELSDIAVPTHCPILGIELIVSKTKRHENSPSLDKIDNTKGYVKGNVRVISWRANRLKGDGTREEHERIAKWMEVHESTS